MSRRETTQARRAALLLHGLSPAARLKVMARLDARQSSRMKSLADELTALGVSPALGRQLGQLTASPGSSASISSERRATGQEQVERLSAADVARCLESCSSMTVVQLLRAGAGPWRTAVLDRMPAARRVEVEACLRKEPPALAPAALAFLRERLCRQAAQLRTNPAQVAAAPAGRSDTRPRGSVRTGVSTHLRRLIAWIR